jgi:outer membrane biosynthesis protein TonB
MSFLNNPAIKALIPSSLGIAASIGFHVIFFSTGLSNFSAVRAEKAKEDMVPIVELTAEERANLPNTNTSTNTFNSTNTQIALPNHSNLASIPTPNAKVNIPSNSPSLTYYTNLNTSSLFPTAPNNYVGAGKSNQNRVEIGSARIINSPSRTNNLPDLGDNTQTKIKIQDDNSLLPPAPPNAVSPDKKSETEVLPNSVSNTMGGLQSSKFQVQEENNQNNNPQDNINTSENNNKTTTQIEQNTNNNNNSNTDNKLSEEEIHNRQQAIAKAYRERQLSLSRNEENTTDKEANANYLAWIEKAQNTKPNRMTIAGTYPQDACLRRLQGVVIYGATINQGKANNLNLIQSSGYAIFNQQAATDIQNRTFFYNLNGATQISVTFDNNDRICTGKVINPNETNETPKIIAPTTEVEPVETPKSENTETKPVENSSDNHNSNENR